MASIRLKSSCRASPPPVRTGNGEELFASKDDAIRAAKLDLGRRRIELAEEERKHRNR
jgi:hypothetical protein